MSGFEHQPWCAGGDHIGKACDHRSAARHEAVKAALRDAVTANGVVVPPWVSKLIEPSTD